MMIALLFMLLLFPTPPLVLGTWIILLLRFGLSGVPFRWTAWLVDPQEEPAARSRSWVLLTVMVLIILMMGFGNLYVVSAGQLGGHLAASALGEGRYSTGRVALTFLYCPVALLLTLEAWLFLLSYFGLPCFLHRRNYSPDQAQQIKRLVITAIYFLALLTGFSGFGWWSNLDQNRYNTLLDFSYIVLSPTTGLLTAGLVIMLFLSFKEAVALDEAGEPPHQVATRMTRVLFASLVLLSLTGGGMSLMIAFGWPI